MKIVCDACGAKYSIADEKVAGKVFKIRCKKCSNIIVVRGVKEEVPAADPAFGHDEKETRVFDYSGYDDPQAAVAADEDDGAIWHLVIDQEQVGPMTANDVRAHFAAGEIEADSFVWREGFDDWERLDGLSEFADLAAAAPAAGDEAAAAMFGGPALDDPLAAGGGDPADLFTAQASAPAADDGGGLFGDVGADDGGLFGASEPMAAAAPEPVDERLTGQRNENSVLFSLNNLASLASDSPKAASPSPSPSPGSGGGGAPAPQPGSAQQDGSGLIDIRAMASMYMGDSGGAQPAHGGGSIDDLPVFSQPSIAAASPVLMPVAAPANSNKVMVGLIAGIGALVLVAVVLLILVLRGDEKEVSASNQADQTDNSAASNAAKNTEPGEGDTDKAGDGDGDKSGDADGDGDKSGDGDEAAAKAAEKEGAGRTEPKADKPKQPERKETARERRERIKKERAEREERKRKEAERRKAEADKPDTSSKGGCDEITCLVDSSKACCRKSGRASGGNSGGNSNLPDRPTKAQVRSGMGRVSGTVKSCGKRSGFSGKVRVRIRISGSGRVSSANASGGPGAVNSCVSRAVKGARFPKTQSGLSFTYGYTL
jgi:predicted Zn finger-like uncharacterized protein